MDGGRKGFGRGVPDGMLGLPWCLALPHARCRSVLGWPPRRAVLSVPGDSARKIRKAAEESECDCVCLDLEDAVAPSQKEAARKGIVEALASLSFGRSERAVRVNPPDSPEFAHDMAAVTAAVRNLDALIVPKVRRGGEEEGGGPVTWRMCPWAIIMVDVHFEIFTAPLHCPRRRGQRWTASRRHARCTTRRASCRRTTAWRC